jgi:hypothetical protein
MVAFGLVQLEILVRARDLSAVFGIDVAEKEPAFFEGVFLDPAELLAQRGRSGRRAQKGQFGSAHLDSSQRLQRWQ